MHSDSSEGSEREPEDDEDPCVAPPVAPRERVSERWGSGNWSLVPIRKKTGAVVTIAGYGAMCKDHLDVDDPAICKKQVSVGKNGLSVDTLRVRMKRWLIAGLDDHEWEEGSKKTHHISMGGTYLVEFEHGLTEEQCGDIAGVVSE